MNSPANVQQLFVSELFRSIQGEGPHLGKPSLFLRLGICNLQCTWCDTPYTWKQGQRDYKTMKIEEILKQLKGLQDAWKIKNIVITGGEPLLQQEGLVQLLQRPFFAGKTIEFETNGSMPLNAAMKNLMKKRQISFNISPKLADSGNREYKVNFYPESVLKFVYVNKGSEKLIDAFMKKHRIAKTPKIYIMPEGTTVEALTQKYPAVVAYCGQRGFIFTPRLQIHLFGNKRAT